MLGSNPGCGTVGFPATFRWDPVRSTRFLSLLFRCWLTLYSTDHGSGDAEVTSHAEKMKLDDDSGSDDLRSDDSGAMTRMRTIQSHRPFMFADLQDLILRSTGIFTLTVKVSMSCH